MLKKSLFSPAQPRCAKTHPSPSVVLPLESILNVAHSEDKLSCSLGWAGEKSYASGAFIGCGLAGRPF
jgi:hypothetical protein